MLCQIIFKISKIGMPKIRFLRTFILVTFSLALFAVLRLQHMPMVFDPVFAVMMIIIFSTLRTKLLELIFSIVLVFAYIFIDYYFQISFILSKKIIFEGDIVVAILNGCYLSLILSVAYLFSLILLRFKKSGSAGG